MRSVFNTSPVTSGFDNFQILSYHNKPYINGNSIYSDFTKIDPFDWFCAPGSRMISEGVCVCVCVCVVLSVVVTTEQMKYIRLRSSLFSLEL